MALINNKKINTIIEISKKYYKTVFQEDISNIQIYVSDDIPNDINLFSENIIFLKNKEKLYGGYIEPNTKSSVATILIKYELFEEYGAPYTGTILHELTHAVDIKKFNLEFCNNNWSYLREHKYYGALYMWSEYHAKITEIIHMKKLLSILQPELYTYDLNLVKQEMQEYQLSRYNKEIIEIINNEDTDLYSFFQYCGRLYACKIYNNNLNIKNIIPQEVYQIFPDIILLYNWLEPLQTYFDISSRLEELTSLICTLT